MARGAVDSYGRFAKYYDFIYHDLVDYEGDVKFLEAVFRRFLRKKPRILLDLGCGTGNHDLLLARRGYDVIGLDLSRPQLAIARHKAREARLPIRFVRGDMKSFDLGTTFDVAVCMFGAFGHLLRPEDVHSCLASLRRCLRPGGIFVYEFWQASGVKPPPNRSWFHKAGPDYELVRLSGSHFDRRTRLLQIEHRFFVFHDGRLLDRFRETGTLRTHSVDGMRRLLGRGGFELLDACAATNVEKGFRPVNKDTFRIIAIARPGESAREGVSLK